MAELHDEEALDRHAILCLPAHARQSIMPCLDR